MKKKISLIAALLALVFMTGCVGELVFVKGDATDSLLYRVKDDGDDRQQINPIPPLPPGWNRIHRPDVNHNGDKVAFTAGSDPIFARGRIWTMNIDGTNRRPINHPFHPAVDPIMARWYPDDDQYIAYFGRVGGGIYGISRAETAGPPNVEQICETNYNDSAGFDLNQPAPALLQIIFARRDPANGNRPKLFRRKVEYVSASCTPGELKPIFAFPIPRAGITDPARLLAEIEESLPVVSFHQKLLASAVKWPGFIGFRIRGIGQDGNIGLPATFKLPAGFADITGLSFAEKDLKIYLSARVGVEHRLYSIGVEEILKGLTDLLNATDPDVIQPTEVEPDRIHVGPKRNVWPSGINEPTS
jgi:hypothetical protein